MEKKLTFLRLCLSLRRGVMPDEIQKALKRLEGAEVKVVIRGGMICKIPMQECRFQTKDGVQMVLVIAEDITEEVR